MAIVDDSKEYVKKRFREEGREEIRYHNWDHTTKVLEAADLIAENTASLSPADKERLRIAAIFHDIGYIEKRQGHEELSARIAEEYLKEHNYPEEGITEVKRLIAATKIGHVPKDKLEKIIIDADLSHLGSEDYLQTSYKLLAEELSSAEENRMSDEEWAERCAVFLNAHNYLTKFARTKYGSIKASNLEKIREMLKNGTAVEATTKDEKELDKPKSEKEIEKSEGKEHKTAKEENQLKGKEDEKKEEKDKDKKSEGKEKDGDKEKDYKDIKEDTKKLKNPLKGVETMFKTALRNHVHLSRIADNKANTLISVNAIIVSIVLSALFPKLDANPYLFYPGITIITSCIITIIVSILSTIPNVNEGKIDKKEVMSKKGNLIFFGNFHKMKLDDYEWSVSVLMNDKEYLYKTLTRDLYYLGVVLHKKYVLLRYSYYIFVVGLIVSIIVFTYNVLPYMDATQMLK